MIRLVSTNSVTRLFNLSYEKQIALDGCLAIGMGVVLYLHPLNDDLVCNVVYHFAASGNNYLADYRISLKMIK